MKLWHVVKSVLAGMIGVQSEANRQRDFSEKSALPFLIVGVISVLLFVISLIAVVNFIAP